MQHSFDVAVVGARCAGSAVARLLARAGVRVLVVDRAAFPSDTVSTHAVAAHGSALLDQWGLLDSVIATGAPVSQVMGVRLGDLEAEAAAVPGGVGFIAPRRTVLDDLLMRAAADAGATVWENTTVEDLITDSGRVRGLVCRAADSNRVEVRAGLVIGADGTRSSVARAVGATHYDVRPSGVSGVYAYYSGTGIKRPEVALSSRGFALFFPTNDDLVCVAVLRPSRDFAALHRGGDGAATEVVGAVSPRLAEALRTARRETRFFVFRGQPGHYKVPFGPGWALVGDAGHYMDPFTGHGIANAFLGAQLLADAVIDGDLARYQASRDGMTKGMHAVTHDLASLDWTEADLPALFLRFRAESEAVAAAVSEPAVETVVSATV